MKKLLIIALSTIAMLSNVGCSSVEANSSQIILKANNTVLFADEVDAGSTAKALQKIIDLDAKLDKKEPIYLILNTPGGSVTDGLEFIDAIKGLNRKVHTITVFAASMGFQIAQQLDKRYIIPNGTLMSHRARGGLSGEFGGQANSQLENRLGFWMGKIKQMDEATVKRSNGKQTYESYTKAYENELWISGAQAVEQGYADSAIKVKCHKDLMGTKSESFMFFGLQVEVIMSNCPLISGPLDVKIAVKTKDGRIVPLNEFYKQGGVFGSACQVDTGMSSKSFVCPLDVTLTEEKLQNIKKEIVSKFTHNNKTKVLYY